MEIAHWTIVWDAHTNKTLMVSKIIESHDRMFSMKLKKARPPLEAGDQPELDQSDFFNEEEIQQYQTLIGQLQWLNSLG